MSIAVIGASGRSGKFFVDHALSNGHSINACVRDVLKLEPKQGLHIVPCDITNRGDVANLIMGCDAVVSLIGHVKGSPKNIQTTAIDNVITAMQEQGIKRLISLTGTGVRFPNDKITVIDRILNFSIALIDPARIKDGVDHVNSITASELDWTIIRVLKLQNTKPRPYALTPNGPTKVIASRSEVAQAILEVLTNHSFIKQAPMLSSKREDK